MNPKFKITFVVEVGEEACSEEEHIKSLKEIIKNEAFAYYDIITIGEIEVRPVK